MKRSERHRLKENEVSLWLSNVSARLRENSRAVGLVAVVIVLVLAVAGGYWMWRARTESQAQLMLGDAIMIVQAPIEEPQAGAEPTPNAYPSIQARAEAALAKFTEVHETYPSTRAGVAARYYAAAALAMLGRPDEAVARYREVVDRAGSDDFYGRMARLGVVEASAQAGQFDQAISAAQDLVDNPSDDTMPRDALLMELGRVQLLAGKNAEARQTLDQVIKEFPDSPYTEEAQQLLAEAS